MAKHSAQHPSALDNISKAEFGGRYDAPDMHMSVGRYLATRIPTLKPPFEKLDNPITLLRSLTLMNWLNFLLGFAGWTWDAFDFFTVSLTVSSLAATFECSTTDITWGITLVLMFRSVGAIFFGLAADRYGRKWPYVVNLLLFVVLELATGFATTLKQFLAIRAIYGIAMGGLYGMAAATALEDCPLKARGIISGMLQQGYAFGYLLATAIARGLVNTTSHGWRPLFWFGACPPVLIIIFRLMMPETQAFQERMAVRKAGNNAAATFVAEGKVALRNHWKVLIYLVLMMAGFNFLSHGSQDLYPTMLTNQYIFGANAVTVTQVVANLGAITGGTVVGYASQSLGRRFTIIITAIFGACLIYPYTHTSTKAVIAAAFFEQFAVQGCWGVIPVHLMELSPGSFRTFVVGTSYQLGNLASSASSTIEAQLGERFPLASLVNSKTHKITHRYNYGKVICIFLGCVYAYLIVLVLLGPENRGRMMDVAHDYDLREVAPEEVQRVVGGPNVGERGSNGGSSDEEMKGGEVQRIEQRI